MLYCVIIFVYNMECVGVGCWCYMVGGGVGWGWGRWLLDRYNSIHLSALFFLMLINLLRCTFKFCVQYFHKFPVLLQKYPLVKSINAEFINQSGGWFNIKMPSYQYRKSHCGDKTILRPSYLHNGISYTGKITSLYWIRVQVPSSFPPNIVYSTPQNSIFIDRFWATLC